MKYLLLLITLSCAMAPTKHKPIKEPLTVEKPNIKGYQFIHSNHVDYLKNLGMLHSPRDYFAPYAGRYKGGKKYYRAKIRVMATLFINEVFLRCGKKEKSIKRGLFEKWGNSFSGRSESVDIPIKRSTLKLLAYCKKPVQIGFFGSKGSRTVNYKNDRLGKSYEPLNEDEYLKTGIKNLLEYGN